MNGYTVNVRSFAFSFHTFCVFIVCCCYSCADAHKFIIWNLSSSETLNRIKDNKLEISGWWTIYNCGDFTKKRRREERHIDHAHRIKYHTWTYMHYCDWSNTAKENVKKKKQYKQLEYKRRRTNGEIRLLLEMFGLCDGYNKHNSRSLNLYTRQKKWSTTSQIARIMITFNGSYFC